MNPVTKEKSCNSHNVWHVCVGLFSSREKLEFTGPCLHSMNLQHTTSTTYNASAVTELTVSNSQPSQTHSVSSLIQSALIYRKQRTREGRSLSESTSESFTTSRSFFSAVTTQYVWYSRV